jgi:hypothetical protein
MALAIHCRREFGREFLKIDSDQVIYVQFCATAAMV